MKIQTNWIVLTGATSSGKSTIAALLDRFGYPAPIEVARKYIYELQTKMTPEELSLFVQSYEFQYEIAQRGLRFQEELDPKDLVVIDCGLMGSFVYFQLRGHGVNFIQKGDNIPLQDHLDQYRYRGVFLFDMLPCDSDPCRFSTTEILRIEAQTLITEVNEKQGYTAIRVPVAPIHERLQYVLGKITAMIPTLLEGYGLKQPSGKDRILILPHLSPQNQKDSYVKMSGYGIKNYSGAYSSLFFGNGSNSVQQKNYDKFLDTPKPR